MLLGLSVVVFGGTDMFPLRQNRGSENTACSRAPSLAVQSHCQRPPLPLRSRNFERDVWGSRRIDQASEKEGEAPMRGMDVDEE